MSQRRRMVVVSAAALGSEFCREQGIESLGGVDLQPIKTVFPAVTCSVQASFRTGADASHHGMVANGLYDQRFRKVRFWEQAASLVRGERIWERFRNAGGSVGMLFWQQSLGESVDMVLSPAPIHTHSGRLLMDCSCKPSGLYGELKRELRGFPLHRYWGPLASARVGDWIAGCVEQVLQRDDAPELLLVYLPTLDYDLQRSGTHGDKAKRAMALLSEQVKRVFAAARKSGAACTVFGDYAITEVTGGPIFPNRLLASKGLLTTRKVAGREYPEFNCCRAFAVVDHEIAHVHLLDPCDAGEVAALFSEVKGVAQVADAKAKVEMRIANPSSGELVLLAEDGFWFAYPWWKDKRAAPDYATHIDIHSKPGFDPCEMFFGRTPMSVSTDTVRIRGTHGSVDRPVAWGTDAELHNEVEDVASLGRAVGNWLVNERP